MTTLVWDQPGERFYETGIDRGVLYIPNAVPWNGLISVAESRSRDVKSFFIDGIKYLDRTIPGTYAAKIQAFTYPDEMEQVLGNREWVAGVTLYDQNSTLFNLSYRTRIANDLVGSDYGYKIHVVYNVVATLSDISFDTMSEGSSANPFEWNLVGVPELVSGMRPTSHISINSSTINPEALETIELRLYGSDTEDPDLPTMAELLEIVNPA